MQARVLKIRSATSYVWPKLLLVVAISVLALWAAHDLVAVPTATYTVNAASGYDGTCDASHCSLSEAISAANSNPGTDP